ncbi:MAG: hypothetical protein RL422_227 [Bacteroidota bacterium]|jgi:hypothetical protein
MIQEFHQVKVDQTFLGYNQFRIPVANTTVQDGRQKNLYFRYNGNVYRFSKTGIRLSSPSIKVFYFPLVERQRFEKENPNLLGLTINIEIFSL